MSYEYICISINYLKIYIKMLFRISRYINTRILLYTYILYNICSMDKFLKNKMKNKKIHLHLSSWTLWLEPFFYIYIFILPKQILILSFCFHIYFNSQLMFILINYFIYILLLVNINNICLTQVFECFILLLIRSNTTCTLWV